MAIKTGLFLVLSILFYGILYPAAEDNETQCCVMTNYSPAWSPDSRSLTFESKRTDKWVILKMNRDGTGIKRLTEPVFDSHSSSWSPNGKQIVFLSNRNSTWDIYTMDSEGGNVKRLTTDSNKEWCPRWSPDGKRIAYVSDINGRKDIYVIDHDGSNRFKVTSEKVDIDGRISWSPDGKITFFATHQGNRKEEDGAPALFWSIQSNGMQLAQLTKQAARESNPTWSPDGSKYSFDAHETGAWESDDGKWEIWTRNASGTDLKRLTHNAVNDWGPAWSPDGSWIAYCSGMDNRYEIWLMKANGMEHKRLTRIVYEGLAPGE